MIYYYLLIFILFVIIVIYITITHLFYENSLLSSLKKISQIPYQHSKIAIITLETRDLNLLPFHNKNVKDYCNNNNYDYFFFKNYENELELPIYWKKIQLVKEFLETTQYDYVVWMDSDTIICKPDIRLEQIILPDKSIYIGNHFPSIISHYNAGFFIIQNNHIGRQFLSDCIATYLDSEECLVDGKLSLPGKWSGSCYEQGIMNKLLATTYNDDFHFLEYAFVVNSEFPITDTFVLHLFSGLDKNKDYVSNIFKRIYEGEKFSYSIPRFIGKFFRLND